MVDRVGDQTHLLACVGRLLEHLLGFVAADAHGAGLVTGKRQSVLRLVVEFDLGVDDGARLHFDLNCCEQGLFELITVHEEHGVLDCHGSTRFAGDSQSRTVADELGLAIRVRNSKSDARSTHLDEGRQRNLVVRLFRFVVSESVINWRIARHHLHLQLLVNSTARHKNDDLDFARTNLVLASRLAGSKCHLAEGQVLEEQVERLCRLQNNITRCHNRVPGRWSGSFAKGNPIGKLSLTCNQTQLRLNA